MVTERCELEMHNVRNACLSGMDHVYHSCLDKTAHTKAKCNDAVSTVINGGTCDVLQGKSGCNRRQNLISQNVFFSNIIDVANLYILSMKNDN